jgi:hypothetical protein
VRESSPRFSSACGIDLRQWFGRFVPMASGVGAAAVDEDGMVMSRLGTVMPPARADLVPDRCDQRRGAGAMAGSSLPGSGMSSAVLRSGARELVARATVSFSARSGAMAASTSDILRGFICWTTGSEHVEAETVEDACGVLRLHRLVHDDEILDRLEFPPRRACADGPSTLSSSTFRSPTRPSSFFSAVSSRRSRISSSRMRASISSRRSPRRSRMSPLGGRDDLWPCRWRRRPCCSGWRRARLRPWLPPRPSPAPSSDQACRPSRSSPGRNRTRSGAWACAMTLASPQTLGSGFTVRVLSRQRRSRLPAPFPERAPPSRQAASAPGDPWRRG